MSYFTFIDSVGRNVLGVIEGSSIGSAVLPGNTITVKNPVMIAVQPNNGQLQIQLVPLFFAEFIKPNGEDNRNYKFVFNLTSISYGVGFEVDEKIIAQYEKIVSATFNASNEPPAVEEPKTVKLFSED